MLPHLERGVLGALLVQGVHDVAVDVDGEALDRPLARLHLSPSEVKSLHFPLSYRNILMNLEKGDFLTSAL